MPEPLGSGGPSAALTQHSMFICTSQLGPLHDHSKPLALNDHVMFIAGDMGHGVRASLSSPRICAARLLG